MREKAREKIPSKLKLLRTLLKSIGLFKEIIKENPPPKRKRIRGDNNIIEPNILYSRIKYHAV